MSLIEKAASKIKKKESLIERASEDLKNVSAANAKDDKAASAQLPSADKARESVSVGYNILKASKKVELDFELMKKNNILFSGDDDDPMLKEEFRIVKRSLLLNAFSKSDGAINNGNIVLVTSTQPNEGKTFCALNLALSMATERDLTVLLVDADVAKPDVLNSLGVKAEKGLIDVIENKDMDLSECLLRTNIPNLSILPAGKKHKLSTELLASERMGSIVDEIARRYRDRIIVIDSPPVLASSSASVLALHVGQILFVVEAEKTREQELQDAIKMVDQCKNINFLLNKKRFSAGKKKFGSYYGYGYE